MSSASPVAASPSQRTPPDRRRVVDPLTNFGNVRVAVLRCGVVGRTADVVAGEVRAVAVVDKTVTVVVDPVADDLAGVDPELLDEVVVIEIEAAVEYRDYDRGGARVFMPARFGTDLEQPPLIRANVDERIAALIGGV